MVPRTEAKVPFTAFLNLCMELLKLSPIVLKFIGVVLGPEPYGLGMAKLKRYPRPVSERNVNNASVTK